MTNIRGKFCAAVAILAMVPTLVMGAAAASTPRSSPRATAAGAPFKVGMVCTCSGTFGAAFGGGAAGFQAWAKTIDASGGVGGRQIELTVKDDAGNPGQASTAAKSLIDDGNVVIIDMSLVSGAWNQLIQDAKVPVIAGPTAVQNPYTFWVGQTTGAGSGNESLAKIAKSAGVKKLGQLYCAESPSCTEGASQLKSDMQKFGLSVVYQAEFASNAANYTSQCIAAQNAGVQMLLVGSQPSTISKVAADCSTQGFKPKYQIGVIQWSPAMLSAPGLEDGTYGAAGNYLFFDKKQPEIARMQKAMKKYYPDVISADNADTPSELVVTMWAGGVLLEKLLPQISSDASKPITRQQFYDGMYTLKNETLNGLSSPITYVKGSNNTLSCWFTAHFKGGKYAVDNGGKYTCPTAA
ncbi:MAG: ABC transporter substrate-binding protein [Acidimicrobiia bacterium]